MSLTWAQNKPTFALQTAVTQHHNAPLASSCFLRPPGQSWWDSTSKQLSKLLH